MEGKSQGWQDSLNFYIFLKEIKMANNLLTISKITNEALMVLENE